MNDEIRCSVELRADETRQGPGRLVGRIVRYGERALDRAELFEPGSLTWPADGVVLSRQHVRGAPIMRVIPIERDGELAYRSTVDRYAKRTGRGDGNSARSHARLVRVVPSAAAIVRGRRAAYPVGRNDGGRSG